MIDQGNFFKYPSLTPTKEPVKRIGSFVNVTSLELKAVSLQRSVDLREKAESADYSEWAY